MALSAKGWAVPHDHFLHNGTWIQGLRRPPSLSLPSSSIRNLSQSIQTPAIWCPARVLPQSLPRYAYTSSCARLCVPSDHDRTARVQASEVDQNCMYKNFRLKTPLPMTLLSLPTSIQARNQSPYALRPTSLPQRLYAFAASLLLCELALITGCCVGRDILDCAVDLILAYA